LDFQLSQFQRKMVQKNPKETISIIIVNWNTKNETARAIKSIYKNCKLKPEIIVVDNNSSDESASYLIKFFSKIKLIKNKENFGYAKANNQGAKLAKSELILILNPDTQFQKGTLEALIDYYTSHPHLGAVVPKLLNTDGTTQYYYHRMLPTLKYQIASLVHNYTPLKNFNWAKEYFLLDKKFKTNTKIEQAAGVCILTKKSIIKKIGGLFDEKFPIFLNDVDFSYRLKKHHMDIYLVANSKIIHHKSTSTSKLDPYTLRQESLLSQIYYFKKNSNYLIYLIFKIAIILVLAQLVILTKLGITKSYLNVPIKNQKHSISKQLNNLKAVLSENRNHSGLVLASQLYLTK